MYAKATPETQEETPDPYTVLVDSAEILEMQGAYDKALQFYFDALQEADAKKDKVQTAFSHGAIAMVYFRLEEYDNSLEHLEKSEKIYKELNLSEALGRLYLKYGMVYEYQGDARAMLYYQKARVLFNADSLCSDLADTYNNIAGYYYKQQMVDSVEYYAKLALEKYKHCGTPAEQAFMYINIAALLNMQKKHEEAVEYNQKGISIAKKHDLLPQLSQGYKNLSETYSYMKKYEKAYDNCLIYMQYKDSILSSEKEETIAELTQKYKAFEKEQEILIHKNTIENRNRLLWVLGGFTVLLFFVLMIIYRLLQIRKRQNKKLRKLNQTKDRLFSIVSHDLKSPTIAQKMALENLKPQVDKIENKDLKNFFYFLEQYTDNQLNIIVNLLNWARTQTDSISFKPQNIDIVKIIKEEINLYAVAMKQKNIKLSEDLPQSCLVFADSQMIGIVIRNLLNNAVKFTGDGGCITLACKAADEQTEISISDTGIGIPREFIDKIQNQEESQSVETRRGTKGEKGTGLGLILCRDLLKRNGSRLIIRSKQGEGTVMQFVLKKQK